MEQPSSTPKPSTPSWPWKPTERRERGLTLAELLIAAAVSLIVIGAALTLTISSRQVYDLDAARTNLNQNLRSSLDILANDTRQAGELLETNFPVITVEKGSGPAGDVLTVRRNVLPSVLDVCRLLPTRIDLTRNAGGSSNARCLEKIDRDALQSWSAARGSGRLRAYVFNPTSRQGRFIEVTGEDFGPSCPTPAGCPARIDEARLVSGFGNTAHAGAFSPAQQPRLYVLEERRYWVDAGNTLILTENGVDKPVAPNVRSLRVNAHVNTALSGGSPSPGTVTPALANGDGSFGPTDNWKTLAFLEITLEGEATPRAGTTITRTVTDRTYPRNAQSY